MQRTARFLLAATAAASLAACSESVPTAATPPARLSVVADSGWVFGYANFPTQVWYEIVDGRAIFDGDIDLGPAHLVPRTRDELYAQHGVPPGAERGVIENASHKRWPGGVVPYVISSSFSVARRQMILDAMAHIEAKTWGLRFVPRQPHQPDYLDFQLSTTCSSPVGRSGGQQIVRLDPSNCWAKIGTAEHEVMHSLGMWHEHQRCDRIYYVATNDANIPGGPNGTNYERKCDPWWANAYSDVFEYDELSAMHYPSFGIGHDPNQPVFHSLRNPPFDINLMGQRDSTSVNDRLTMNHMYPPFHPDVSITYPGNVPTFTWNPNGEAYLEIKLVIQYEEYENWTGAQTVYDYSVATVGTPTGGYFQDTGNTYTGEFRCIEVEDMYYNRLYSYWYEVRAIYSGGTPSPSASRYTAFVAPSPVPPCF